MDFYTLVNQEVLERISRHCPESLGTYIHCINRADPDGKVVISRNHVENDMSETWTKFRNHVKKLAIESLLEWTLIDAKIFITLAPIDENE